MLSLLLAVLFFAAIHLGVAGTRLRDVVVGVLGKGGFTLAFSVASVAGIAWLVVAYNRVDYQGLWMAPQWWKLVADVLMLPAFVLVVAGLLTPNPTAMAQEQAAARPPTGIVQVTRHPFLMGVALWAFLHLVANGDLGSVLFFGFFLVVALAGAPSIDAKRRRALGAGWENFARQTSILPFGAIGAGRLRPDWGSFSWWRIGAGVLAYMLFIGGHRHIVGVSPFPVW